MFSVLVVDKICFTFAGCFAIMAMIRIISNIFFNNFSRYQPNAMFLISMFLNQLLAIISFTALLTIIMFIILNIVAMNFFTYITWYLLFFFYPFFVYFSNMFP